MCYFFNFWFGFWATSCCAQRDSWSSAQGMILGKPYMQGSNPDWLHPSTASAFSTVLSSLTLRLVKVSPSLWFQDPEGSSFIPSCQAFQPVHLGKACESSPDWAFQNSKKYIFLNVCAGARTHTSVASFGGQEMYLTMNVVPFPYSIETVLSCQRLMCHSNTLCGAER